MPTFITPVLLAGGLLIAVPILLHLVMRERPRPLEFPALRFLQTRREANRRRLKIRHLLLLLLRCLAILLLAFALARPIFYSSGVFSGGRMPVAAALAFDTRPRMNFRHQNQSRLDAAKALGLDVVGQLPSDSELVVIDTSNPRTRFDMDRGAAAERIKQLTTTGHLHTLIDMVDNALRVLKSTQKPRREIYLFTDMAAVDWESKSVINAWQQRLEDNPEVNFYLVDVGVKQPRNFSLGDLEITREVVSETDLLQITTEVHHLGAAGKQTVQLYLLDENGILEKKGEQLVDCHDGQASQVDFQTRVGNAGTLHGNIRLSRGDDLEVDNIRYFTVQVRSPHQILIVAPDPPHRYSHMLTTALSPPTLRQRGETKYEFHVISYEKLVTEKLPPFDMVWLLDPPPLSARLWDDLTAYVDTGGGLAMALGGAAGLSPERFNTTASPELMPAKLIRQWRVNDLYLAPDQLEHLILQRFKSRQDAIPWQQNPIFKFWEVGPLAEDSHVVIPYSDGKPALVSRNLGEGKFLLLTTSLTSSGRSPWNDLLAPRENAWPGFVLVDAMADYLVGMAGQRLNYVTGEVALLGLCGQDEDFDSYLLRTPTGSRRIAPDDRKMQLAVSSTETPGHYRIGAGGSQGADHGFSVNLPAAATNVRRMDLEKFAKNFDKMDLPVVTTLDQLSQTRKDMEARTRWEASPWLIMLVAFVVAGEGLFSAFFYRRRKESGTL